MNSDIFSALSAMSMFSRMITSRNMNIMPNQDEKEAFIHFKERYYENASFYTHFEYIQTLVTYKKIHRVYPTDRDFYMFFRNQCMCNLSVVLTDDDFYSASHFFIRQIGNITSHQCEFFYYFKEFHMIEHRTPHDMTEFYEYMRRMLIAQTMPDVLFSPNDDESKTTALSDRKIDSIKTSSYKVVGESCGICQDDINDQDAVKLDCGHYFHSLTKDCCETGTIFTWLSKNCTCPVCRADIENNQI